MDERTKRSMRGDVIGEERAYSEQRYRAFSYFVNEAINEGAMPFGLKKKCTQNSDKQQRPGHYGS